ncbi:hypothetical protein [Leptolyngbya sp. ST-U4]|uniref:hypothetical protein n=1 Tax=Leptolyngbya sp. ST-U4 TaxID=2933912 RepID=UPI003298F0CE
MGRARYPVKDSIAKQGISVSLLKMRDRRSCSPDLLISAIMPDDAIGLLPSRGRIC